MKERQRGWIKSNERGGNANTEIGCKSLDIRKWLIPTSRKTVSADTTKDNRAEGKEERCGTALQWQCGTATQ